MSQAGRSRGKKAKKSSGEEEETVPGQIVRLFTPSPKNSTIIFPNGWKRIYLKKKKKKAATCLWIYKAAISSHKLWRETA